MINFKDFIRWIPDSVSEDRVNMVLLQAVLSENWGLSYYNPPSGSWKGVSIYREGYEYRQVGPKRGVTRMKRPDIAFQNLAASSKSPHFFLVESKTSRRDWSNNLPSLLQAYFDDKNEGVRRLPFDHRRLIGTGSVWESLKEDDPSRTWFQDVQPLYHFGFAYGPVPIKDLHKQKGWMRSMLKNPDNDTSKNKKALDPIVMVAVAFAPDNLKPQLTWEYSLTFPIDLMAYLDQQFTLAMMKETF